ncbi:MAG: glycosyl transferase family 2 [Acidobacteriota bacterium]
MTREEVLPREAIQRLNELGSADIVIGVPSYQNAGTIGHVVGAAQAGLAKYFPQRRAVILNSDGGSKDGTPGVVRDLAASDAGLLLLSHPVTPAARFSVPYHGIPGKGSAFRCIFRSAEVLGARACAVVDSDLRSITPEWIQLLVAPVLEREFDYVAPYYLRHKFDGTITNSIVYPLTRALYGRRVRQPIGGEFGMSARLVSHYLTEPVWDTDVARYGIDIWMTTTALCGDYRVCQAFLGAKIHDAKDPSADLSGMFVQVLGTLFRMMETHEAVWATVKASQPVPTLGFPFAVGLEPVSVNLNRLVEHFSRGVRELGDIWSDIFDAGSMSRLVRLSTQVGRAFRMDDDLWVSLVYGVASAYHHRVMDREVLLRAALPLYMGRVASFVNELLEASADQVEGRLEELCVRFEGQKDELVRLWAKRPGRPAARPGGGSRPV